MLCKTGKGPGSCCFRDACYTRFRDRSRDTAR